MLRRPCASARPRLNRSSDFHEILSLEFLITRCWASLSPVLNGLMTGSLYLGRRYIYDHSFRIYLSICVIFWHRLFSKYAVQQI